MIRRPIRHRRGTRLVFALMVLCTLGGGTVVAGQADPVEPPAPDDVTAELVSARIQEARTDTTLDEALRTKLLEAYELAEKQLSIAAAQSARAAALKQQIETAPARIAELQGLLQSTPLVNDPALDVAPDATSDELGPRLTQEQTDLTTQKGRLARVENDLRDLGGRPAQAREELVAVRQKLEQVERDLGAPAPAEEPATVTAARRIALEARRRARTADAAVLEQEIVGQDARAGVLTAERDWLVRQIANAEARLKALQSEIDRRRRAEAEAVRSEAEQARRESVGKHAAVRALAEQNAALSQSLTEIVDREQQTAKQREQVSGELERIVRQFDDARKKLEVAGLSETLGHILRDQRNRLPNVAQYQRRSAERSQELAEVGLEQLRLDDLRREVTDVEAAIAARLSEADDTLSDRERPVVEAEMRTLITAQKDLLDKLGPAYGSYVNALGNIDFEQKQLVAEVEDYAQFLDERLLWIPSAPALSLSTLGRIDDDVKWLASSDHWPELLSAFRSAYLRFLPALVFTFFVALLAMRRWMVARCEQMATRVGRFRTDGFRLTVETLLIVLLIALPWALLLGYAGWRLRADFRATSFVRGFGHGLLLAATLLYPIRVLAGFCTRPNFAEVHLGWSAHATGVLRRNLRWLVFVAPPLAFLIAFTAWQTDESHQAGLGRLAFVALMIAFSIFVARVLRPGRGVPAPFLRRRPDGLSNRLRFGWYPVAIAIPLILAVMAAAGYYYTAQQLLNRLLVAVLIVVVAIVVHDVVMRALALARQKLAVKQAQARRAAQLAAGAGEADTPISVEPPTIDLAAINQQTRQFVVGVIGVTLVMVLWAVWADVLPALAILDKIEMWEQRVIVDGEATMMPITLRDLGLTALIAVLTVIAARDLPGAMDMMVLGRLPIDAGTRYAISSISRYIIVTLGVVLAFNTIGVGWPEVQWLLAALTVGLGFGLQEIFANFVSGLIILIERPIRVGDTVTVGGVSGIVTRIRIRATTVTDWNRKELIVPNKRFITEDVINWTLSDPLTRLDIPVGLAYGSDTELALRLMHEAARGVSGALESPEPEVFFVGFGDNSLNFEVRVYAREMTNRGRTKVVHGVHLAVDTLFREHGVVIAFPQRDLHLKSSDVPITIVMQGPDGTVVPAARPTEGDGRS